MNHERDAAIMSAIMLTSPVLALAVSWAFWRVMDLFAWCMERMGDS